MHKQTKRYALLTALLLFVFTLPALPVRAQEETVYLTWDEHKEANGIDSWNYNDMAQAIEKVANHAYDLYVAGNAEEAYEFAKATYWGYYETSGFERNTMNYISSSRVSQVELGFTTLRKSIKKDQGEAAVREAADTLIGYLMEDALILSPEGAVNAAGASEENAEGTDAAGKEWPYAAELETYYLSWDEYQEAAGVTEWNYNDMASVIAGVANHAVELYTAGNADEAYEYAKATYWGYYEISGFERNTMNYISSSRVSEVELGFTTLRKSIKKDQGEAAVREAADALTEKLFTDAMILSPDGPVYFATATASGNADAAQGTTAGPAEDVAGEGGAGASVGSGIAIFLGSFGIILREGLEAILIVGAIIAYLVKTGNEKGVKHVYVGSALGVVCSFIMAAILNYLLAKSAEYKMSQEIIEGVAALTAVVVLFYVSNWMISKTESATWTKYIKDKAGAGAEGGSMLALVFTAWLAVFREGAEVILFYQPMLREDRPDMVWAGFGVGVAALVVIFLLIRVLSVRLPIGPFFMATSILMAVMSISFLGAGIKELMEGGVFDNVEWALSSPSWLSWIPYNDTLDVLGIYPLVGTVVPQLILLAITIVTFVMHIRRGKTAKAAASEA